MLKFWKHNTAMSTMNCDSWGFSSKVLILFEPPISFVWRRAANSKLWNMDKFLDSYKTSSVGIISYSLVTLTQTYVIYIRFDFEKNVLDCDFAVLLVLFNKAALSSYNFPCANVITLCQVCWITSLSAMLNEKWFILLPSESLF